jgi:hypothetical protein
MKLMLKLLPFPLLLVLAACPSGVEKNARDTAAALNGALVSAQSEYQTSCTNNPQLPTCVTINRGVAAQNALITATELYCGWATSGPPPDPNQKCVPVSSFQAGLQSALNNANQAVTDIKGIIK